MSTEDSTTSAVRSRLAELEAAYASLFSERQSLLLHNDALRTEGQRLQAHIQATEQASPPTPNPPREPAFRGPRVVAPATFKASPRDRTNVQA